MQTGHQPSSSRAGRALVEDDWSWLARDLALSPRELKRGASAFVPQAHNSTSSSISRSAVPQLQKQPSSSSSTLLQFLGNNFPPSTPTKVSSSSSATSSLVAAPPPTSTSSSSSLIHQQPAAVETNAASTLLQQLQPSNKTSSYNHVNSKIPSTSKVSDASSYNKYIVEDDRHRFPPSGGNNENDSRAGRNIGRRGQARMVLGQQLRSASSSSTTPTKKPVTITSMPTDVIHKTGSSSTASTTALSISSSTSTITATAAEPATTIFSEFVKLNEYKTIHEVIQVAYEHENLSPKHMSAVWTSLSRLVIASTRHQFREIPQNWLVLEGKLSTLVDRMISSLHYYTPIFITQSALSIGKIIKTVSNVTTSGNNQKTIHMFRTVLVGKNDIQKTKIYQAIATTTVPLLNQFDAQGFSNMAYACAITKTIPRCHGRSLFDHITDAICLLDNEAMKTFTPQNLTNIVWAFATAKIFSQRVCKYIPLYY